MENPAELTILGAYRQTFPCAVTSCEGRDLRVLMAQRIAPGAPVRVAMQDSLLLGEVVACEGRGGWFEVTLEVEQVLRHTAALADLARRFLDDT